jgi:hypothetical protein
LVGQLGVAAAVIVGLVVFFVVALILNVTLSPFGVSEQTIGAIAGVVFFAAFWGLGLKYLVFS